MRTLNPTRVQAYRPPIPAASKQLSRSVSVDGALPDFRTSPLYSEPERVALKLAEVMTEASVSSSDELYARLQEHFDALEVAATAALENYRARFNRVFLIEPNALHCPIGKH